MKSQKIVNAELERRLVSSLPARPNREYAAGGVSFSSTALRAAFDRLPLLLVERYNALFDDIESGEISELFKIGLKDGQTLSSLIEDIKSGAWAGYFYIESTPLYTLLKDILSRLEKLEEVSG